MQFTYTALAILLKYNKKHKIILYYYHVLLQSSVNDLILSAVRHLHR